MIYLCLAHMSEDGVDRKKVKGVILSSKKLKVER